MTELVKTTVRIPKDLLEKVREIANEEYISMSEVIREAIRRFVKYYESNKKKGKIR